MYNVLVVEDEVNILKLMNIRLTKSGFNVFCAENGEVALAVVNKEEIDLVVADVMMPVMDGFEFVERMLVLLGIGSLCFSRPTRRHLCRRFA